MNISRMTIDEEEFEVDLKEFEADFRQVFFSLIPLMDDGDFRSVWEAAKADVLPSYPSLEWLYNQHGIYHREPYLQQPRAAQLGRKVAGVMSSVQKEAEAKQREETNTMSGARYTSVTKRGNVEELMPEKGKARAIGPDQSDYLVEVLRQVNKGEYITLEYEDPADLRRDQSLIRTATTRLGWFDGMADGFIPFRTWATNHNDAWYLTVAWLSKPRRSKRYSNDR